MIDDTDEKYESSEVTSIEQVEIDVVPLSRINGQFNDWGGARM